MLHLKAIIYLKLNVEIYPNDFWVYDALADAYMKNKQYQLALNIYQRSIELNPDNTTVKKKIDFIKKIEE